MDISAFEQITSSLTVKSICGALSPDVPAGTSFYELGELLDPRGDPNLDPWNNPSRVVDSDGRVLGVLWFDHWAGADDWDEQLESDKEKFEFVDEVMECPKPHEFLSADTTILDIVELFGRNDDAIFYVTHINQIIGILRYSDLFRPLGRLAFLALALEIEDLALSLCQFQPVREQCWLSLSKGRKRKARSLFKLRYGRKAKPHEIDRLIECTQLTDKASMIWNQKLVVADTRAEVLRFFNVLRKIRDACAHPGTEGPLLPKEKLAHFVASAKRMRSSLLGSMQTKGVPLVRKKSI
jgi:hypothetical protein